MRPNIPVHLTSACCAVQDIRQNLLALPLDSVCLHNADTTTAASRDREQPQIRPLSSMTYMPPTLEQVQGADRWQPAVPISPHHQLTSIGTFPALRMGPASNPAALQYLARLKVGCLTICTDSHEHASIGVHDIGNTCRGRTSRTRIAHLRILLAKRPVKVPER